MSAATAAKKTAIVQNRRKGVEALNMTDFMTILKERRSVRKYEEKEVPQEILDQILEAVRWSPSWANTQCWEVVVIKDPAIKTKLQETLVPKNPATKAIVSAPVLLALCGKRNSSGYYGGMVTTKFGDWFMFDLGIATQSLCLAAHAQGLGTCILAMAVRHPDLLRKLLPEAGDRAFVIGIALGYPDPEAAINTFERPRAEVDEFVTWVQ